MTTTDETRDRGEPTQAGRSARAGRSGSASPSSKPLLLLLTKRRWSGGENIPATGGCVLVVNHISHLDPFTFAHFLYAYGRIVRFLAKAEMFDLPVLGRMVRSAKQIPVYRLTSDASLSFTAAVEAVARRASAWWSTPRARSPASPTCGR